MGTAILTAVVVLAVNVGTLALYQWWQARQVVIPVTTPADITAAVRMACLRVGLPEGQLSNGFDLVSTGKLYAVLHHAALLLGKNHELRTVQDVIDWLAEAPRS